MYLLVIGSYKAYGILYTEIDEYYDVGSGPVAFIGSLIFGIMFASGMFKVLVNTNEYWTRGYKTFFMLNSTEHESFPAHKC